MAPTLTRQSVSPTSNVGAARSTPRSPGSLDTTEAPSELSLVVIQLLKGPLYRESHDKLWDSMLKLRAPVADYVGVLGLLLEIDESDGWRTCTAAQRLTRRHRSDLGLQRARRDSNPQPSDP